MRLNNTPHEIALGVSIGVFIAILPLYGFHTLLVLIAAVLVRPANKIAILAGTNISLPPTLPFITWAGYEIGRAILGGKFPPLGWLDFKNITLEKIASLYPALFLGSFILGISCAIIFYFLTFLLVRKLKSRKDALDKR
jgi:uncharacterized protein (DUF2062 family)